MQLNHECPVCKIIHEKESTPEPDQICDTCKFQHEGEFIIMTQNNVPVKNINKNAIEFYKDINIADEDRIYYQTDYNELLKIVRI